MPTSTIQIEQQRWFRSFVDSKSPTLSKCEFSSLFQRWEVLVPACLKELLPSNSNSADIQLASMEDIEFTGLLSEWGKPTDFLTKWRNEQRTQSSLTRWEFCKMPLRVYIYFASHFSINCLMNQIARTFRSKLLPLNFHLPSSMTNVLYIKYGTIPTLVLEVEEVL